MTTPIQQLQQLRHDLAAQFRERREVIEGTLYALLSRESVLLLGPPGTGKSSLVRAVAQAFGARYFERLLTKFTTPEEIFGPVSLKALENDRYTRITTDKLPEAEIAVIDETFFLSPARRPLTTPSNLAVSDHFALRDAFSRKQDLRCSGPQGRTINKWPFRTRSRSSSARPASASRCS